MTNQVAIVTPFDQHWGVQILTPQGLGPITPTDISATVHPGMAGYLVQRVYPNARVYVWPEGIPANWNPAEIIAREGDEFLGTA